jgi:hypothetical protein
MFRNLIVLAYNLAPLAFYTAMIVPIRVKTEIRKRHYELAKEAERISRLREPSKYRI